RSRRRATTAAGWAPTTRSRGGTTTTAGARGTPRAATPRRRGRSRSSSGTCSAASSTRSARRHPRRAPRRCPLSQPAFRGSYGSSGGNALPRRVACTRRERTVRTAHVRQRRGTASLATPQEPEGPDLAAVDHRTAEVALGARLDHVDEALEGQAVVELGADDVERHAGQRAEARPAAVALDVLADADQRRQEAARSFDLPVSFE